MLRARSAAALSTVARAVAFEGSVCSACRAPVNEFIMVSSASPSLARRKGWLELGGYARPTPVELDPPSLPQLLLEKLSNTG